MATNPPRGVTDGPEAQRPEAQRLEAIVRGHVQGVGFRWFVVRRASKLGLNAAMTCPLATSIATSRRWVMPLAVVKSPPTYNRVSSGDLVRVIACPFNATLNGNSCPVTMS